MIRGSLAIVNTVRIDQALVDAMNGRHRTIDGR